MKLQKILKLHAKIVSSVLLITSLVSCQNNNTATGKKVSEEFIWLVDSMQNLDYTKISDCTLPYGISNSEILGYTRRNKDGIFFKKELKLNSASISSIKLEKESKEWTIPLHFYRFSFTNKEEEKKFVAFQKFCSSYQSHSKCKAVFFKHDGFWFLKYTPMP